MFSFFGFRKDSVKKSSEKETDGFVFIGETSEERKQKQVSNNVQPSTNVIVQPSKSSTGVGPSGRTEVVQAIPATQSTKATAEPLQSSDIVRAHPELLGDIPFTLAPHILTMQSGLPLIPDFVLPRDINENLASFCYDFTLENSVLCEP